MNNQPCPVCAATSVPFDVVDFNKSCEEAKGKYLPLSGHPICYFLCSNCGFCFAPEIYQWSIKEFELKIYNEQYIEVDPDYIDVRPRNNSITLVNMFAAHKSAIRHLDYGGGSGLLSQLLRQQDFDSTSFDPFFDSSVSLETLGKFNLITAFEVFEHVPDVNQLKRNLAQLLTNDGVLLFSTMVSDDQIKYPGRLTWWYASPRNGHISLYSQKSLSILASQENLHFGSFSAGSHAFWRKVPTWARHLMS